MFLCKFIANIAVINGKGRIHKNKKCTCFAQNLHFGTRLSEMGAMLGSNLVLGESIAL